jgi:hypothetical protein
MPRKAPNPEVVAEAVRLVRAGTSLRDVAEAAGVSYATIKRWADAAPPPEATAAAADVKARARKLVDRTPAEPPPVDPMAGVDENDSLAFARAQRRAYLLAAKQAQAEGSHAVAQRAHRDAAQMSILIARLEKQAQDGDAITISRADLERAKATIDARILALTSGPIFCGECRKKLFG